VDLGFTDPLSQVIRSRPDPVSLPVDREALETAARLDICCSDRQR